MVVVNTQELVVYRGEVVALVSVHVGASLLDVDGLLTFLLIQSGSLQRILEFCRETECPVEIICSPIAVGCSSFWCYFSLVMLIVL